MLNFIRENWFILIGILIVLGYGGYYLTAFLKRPRESQLQQVKEWLLYAVTKAEKEFGSGTGQIKLRYVYNMFVTTFPALARFIPFETYSKLVDEVLEQFRNLLGKNSALEKYVNSNSSEEKK